MTYSATEDLLTGTTNVPQSINPQKYVDDASDEVDSVIGFRYTTPVDMSDPGPVIRPARLLLKRVANFLATGRLIMAAAITQEDKQLNAYGQSLVAQAQAILTQIAAGDIVLPGADEGSDSPPIQSGPLIYNKDIESNVEAFYDRVVAPDGPLVGTPVWPGVFL